MQVVWLLVGGVLLAALVAVVLLTAVVRHGMASPSAAPELLAAEPWLAQERVRLVSVALLGAIAGAGALIATVRFRWEPGVFLAGSVGAFATLVAAVLLSSPDALPGAAGPRAGGPGRVRADARGVGLVGALCLLAVTVLIGAASVAVPLSGRLGPWGLPYRQVISVRHDSPSAPPIVEYGDSYLRPWPGWVDVAIAIVLSVAVLVLLMVVLRRLEAEAPVADADLVATIRDRRVRVLVGVVAGGLLVQLGVTGLVLGLPLATLIDMDPTAMPEVGYPWVAIQPHATVGAILVTVGVLALVVAVIQLVLAGVGISRLGGSLSS